MNRRNTLAALSVAALAACSGTVTPAQSQAEAAKIVSIAQASETTLTNVLAIYDVTPTPEMAAALKAADAAVAALADAAPQGADAVVKMATDPLNGTVKLITAAGTVVLHTLQAAPNAAPAVRQVQMALAALPLIATLAQTIMAPTAPGAMPHAESVAAARAIGVRM